MKNQAILYPIKIAEVDYAGITVSVKNRVTRIDWAAIRSLIAFKTDKLIYDSICLQINYDLDKIVIVDEETEGWQNLVKGVKRYLPSINQTWDTDIVLPSFASNLTTLYNRGNERSAE